MLDPSEQQMRLDCLCYVSLHPLISILRPLIANFYMA